MSLAVDSALENPATLLAGLGSLAALLAVAVVYDRRAGHVPGVLCYCGALLGILLHTLLPDGLGFASRDPGGLGAAAAIAGSFTGIATFLPLVLMRAASAGDVKLLGMVGAFLGPADTVGVVLLTFLFGALLTIAVPATVGIFARLAHDARSGRAAGAEPQPDTSTPASYVMAIALATCGWLLFKG